MTTPVRLQLSRRKGFDLQAASRAVNGLDAVNVARPGRWGNPFDFRPSVFCWAANHFGERADRAGRVAASIKAFHQWLADREAHPSRVLVESNFALTASRPGEKAVDISPRARVRPTHPAPMRGEIVSALRGKNLACWCKPGAPCHADVLLELANAPICEAVEGGANGPK